MDNGQTISFTLRREFMEEALNIAEAGKEDVQSLDALLDDIFAHPVPVYEGYRYSRRLLFCLHTCFVQALTMVRQQ